MPSRLRFDWRCTAEGCRAVVEVSRSLRTSGEPPIDPCPICGGTEFRKLIGSPMLFFSEDHKSSYPLKIRAAEKRLRRDKTGKVVADKNGVPVVDYVDKVFKNQTEQRNWMNQRGLSLTGDFESPSMGTSMRSHYDIDISAPSREAERLAEQTFFVEDPERAEELINRRGA